VGGEGGRGGEREDEGEDFLLGRALLDHDCGFCEYKVRDRSLELPPGGGLTELECFSNRRFMLLKVLLEHLESMISTCEIPSVRR
jgi:hypothetical protein